MCDTGPVLHLSEAGVLYLLEWLGEVQVPPAVDAEVAQHDPDWRRPRWLRVTPLVSPPDTDALAWQQAGLLGAGESEAIALACQVGAEWLLTDDAAARLFAESLGLEAHGSLGVVLWAAAVGRLNRIQAEAALNGLVGSSLWVSAQVMAEARAALGRLFP
ncbi:MAG: hypothetical protein HY321_00755 [Armatimonadetes bacterium]|nr:hypothetical protein [Armatimonadota bacterium]